MPGDQRCPRCNSPAKAPAQLDYGRVHREAVIGIANLRAFLATVAAAAEL